MSNKGLIKAINDGGDEKFMYVLVVVVFLESTCEAGEK